MKEELISVVVPIYNVEEYVEKCIYSILRQDYRKLEIILVDDGSTDKSGDICDAFKSMDDRVKVIHKINGGLSDARNAGIAIASGEYFGFVDGDDYISSDMFSRLYYNLVKRKADISCCSCIRISNNTSRIKNKSTITTGDENDFYISCLRMENGNDVSVCNKLYKRKIFNKIRFKTGLYIEDYYTLPEIVGSIKRYVIESFPGYFYIKRNNSITNSENHNLHILDRLEGVEHNISLLSNKNLRIKKCAIDYGLQKYFVCCRLAYKSENGDYKRILEELEYRLRQNKYTFLTSPYINKKVKLYFLFWCINPNLYYNMFRRLSVYK